MYMVVNIYKLTSLVLLWYFYIPRLGGHSETISNQIVEIACLSILQIIDDFLGADRGLLGRWGSQCVRIIRIHEDISISDS